MTDTSQTLETSIPPADFSNIVEAVKSALTKGDAGVRLKSAGLDSQTLHSSAAQAVESALKISLFDALLKAWEGMKSVRALMGDKGPTDGKPRIAALIKHKLKVTHTPEVRLTFGEAVDLRKVRLPVTLSVEAAGVALTIQDRQITAISAGYLQPSVKINVEKVTVVETKLQRLDLTEALHIDWPRHADDAPEDTPDAT